MVMSAAPALPGFVTTEGTRFLLNGRDYRVAGANNYYLGFAGDSAVEAVLDLAQEMGLNTLRTWAFLDCGAAAPGATPENAQNGVFFHYWNPALGMPAFHDGPHGLERLDRTIAWAGQRGLRLILPLVNYWSDFGGVDQYLQWFGLTGRDEFFIHPEVKSAYRGYLEHLALRVNTRTGRRYRDEPAILAWELINEPRCASRDGRLVAWVEEMSAFLKRLDPNHLIGVGDEGYARQTRRPWKRRLSSPHSGADWKRLLAAPAIDFGTCHLYPAPASKEDPARSGRRRIREHLKAGRRAGKPVLVEEFGVKMDTDGAGRDNVYRAWLDEVVKNQGAGAAVWMIASSFENGSRYPDYDGYTIYSAGEVPALVSFAGSDRV